jgi:hypothetical protein
MLGRPKRCSGKECRRSACAAPIQQSLLGMFQRLGLYVQEEGLACSTSVVRIAVLQDAVEQTLLILGEGDIGGKVGSGCSSGASAPGHASWYSAFSKEPVALTCRAPRTDMMAASEARRRRGVGVA